MVSKGRTLHDDLFTIEKIIDRAGLAMTLGLIHDICHGKAAHLEIDWQDTATASAWRNAGDRVNTCAESNAVTRVSRGGKRT